MSLASWTAKRIGREIGTGSRSTVRYREWLRAKPSTDRGGDPFTPQKAFVRRNTSAYMDYSRSRLGTPTKIALGVFAVLLLSTVLFYNGWVFSTSLPRYTYLLVATVVVSVVTALLLVNDVVAQ